VNNVTIRHCDFDEAAGRTGLQSKILLGKGDAGASGTCDNILVEWTRFDGEGTSVVAGNEQIQLFNASNATMRYCWADSGGEDAFEIEGPWANCTVHHCGGTGVNGNLVDFFGLGGVWANSTACSIHDIWGDCGSDAVVVDSCTNVTVYSIDANNAAGGFADNPPASNVRLHSRGAGSLNGTSVVGSLTTPNECFGYHAAAPATFGWPCLLTYESTAGTTVAVATNSTTMTLTSATGFAIGQLVSIELDAQSSGLTRLKHYTTISNLVAAVMTITDAMPSAASATRIVQTVAGYNDGTVTWPKWNGSAFTSGTGSNGVVDKIAL
jgi:hypothetical protein